MAVVVERDLDDAPERSGSENRRLMYASRNRSKAHSQVVASESERP